MTGKEQKHEATANVVTKLVTALSDFVATIGLMPSLTKIHNNSDKPIFLIPISCARGADPSKTGKIEEKLAKEIKKKEIKLVDWRWYDRSRNTFPSEIHILFRAVSKTDDRQTFLKDMKAACHKGIILSKGEELHRHNFLCQEPDVRLKLEGGIVIVNKEDDRDGEKKKGDQTEQIPESPFTETQERSTQDLVEQVEELRNDVDVLKNQMVALIDLFQGILSEPNGLLSPDTPSSS